MVKKPVDAKDMKTTRTRPKYEKPELVTYKENELLKHMGVVKGTISGRFLG